MAWDAKPKYDPNKYNRKSTRLHGYDYTQAGAYFVTMVTYQRDFLFGEIVEEEMKLNEFGKIADECWLAIPDHFDHVELGAYVIMPNHVHGIIIINDNRRGAIYRAPAVDSVGVMHASPQQASSQQPSPQRGLISGSLGAIVGSFKSAVSRRIGRAFDITGIWQRNFHDRIIRNEGELERIWRYIETNPSNWADDNENPRL